MSHLQTRAPLRSLSNYYGVSSLPVAAPLTKQAQWQAAIPWLINGARTAAPWIMRGAGAYFTGKGMYDLGKHDIPNIAHNIAQRNWSGTSRALGQGAMDAILAAPGVGWAGRGLKGVAEGGKALGLVGEGSKLLTAGGNAGRWAVNANRGINAVNSGVKTIAGTRVGRGLATAATRGPQFLMNPNTTGRGLAYGGSMFGTGLAGEMGAEALRPRSFWAQAQAAGGRAMDTAKQYGSRAWAGAQDVWARIMAWIRENWQKLQTWMQNYKPQVPQFSLG
jgi:hypothetical protein